MMKQSINVKVIGCGGVGGCLLNTLPRYLAYLKDYLPNLTLVDGDSYDKGNSERQEFERMGNKAEVTAERLRRLKICLSINTVTNYITALNIPLVIKEGDVIFGCVDNHKTRKLISDHCENLNNVVFVSGGNRKHDGNVQIYIRKDGVDITRPITYLHKEIQNPKDHNPGDATLSCDTLVSTEPQYLATNNLVAAFMFKLFDLYIRGGFSEGQLDELYFAENGSARTVKR